MYSPVSYVVDGYMVLLITVIWILKQLLVQNVGDSGCNDMEVMRILVCFQ